LIFDVNLGPYTLVGTSGHGAEVIFFTSGIVRLKVRKIRPMKSDKSSLRITKITKRRLQYLRKKNKSTHLSGGKSNFREDLRCDDRLDGTMALGLWDFVRSEIRGIRCLARKQEWQRARITEAFFANITSRFL
jgi:hypothetical protein